MNRLAIAVVLGSTTIIAQGSPTFEVASVRPTPESVAPGAAGVRIAGSQARFTAIPLRQYIIWAYQVRSQQILGPDWLAQPKFDLTAVMPAGASIAQLPAMLEALLADRFQMKAHRETRPLPAYALTVANGGLKIPASQPLPLDFTGAKLPEVDVRARSTGTEVGADLGRGSSIVLHTDRLEAIKVTMSSFADMLSSYTDRPVLDETGLTGPYDIRLDIDPDDYPTLRAQGAANAGVTLSPEGYRMLAEARPNALSGPLQKLGLTLGAHKGPVEVVVVDSIAKTPTGN
ncbi:MAG TPA: TIGR03435 family protein [Vicinamibacterales bacterium]|nr:TIGR03435 family protein [Vicinamibacterales bacterium]